MELYSYFRSSAAYRVRIALNLKKVPWTLVPVHLLRGGGEQHSPEYKLKNPLGVVPSLATDSAVLTQSLAIIEWLEETYPEHPLLPASPDARAYVRAIAQTIACDIHPLNNLRVLHYLTHTLGVSDAQKNEWYRHWIREGLGAVEKLIADHGSSGTCCYGDTPSMADCCLIPQIFNAKRFDCPLSDYPHIQRIAAFCDALEPFALASPGRQLDAEGSR
nr:maleylacetoacetate isomerase [uncultured Rhodoferax sp.]